MDTNSGKSELCHVQLYFRAIASRQPLKICSAASARSAVIGASCRTFLRHGISRWKLGPHRCLEIIVF